ncbi:MAG: coenzyme F420-0:L-glutamate ligase [Firmicutes bacterium]|nr:coenzyme F420-0:L-glutamate ligase [Bacillota bacterium]
MSKERLVGTVSRGIRCPIIREGDDLVSIVTDSVIAASENEEWGFNFHDRDIVAITESVVARAQGNYATVDDIAKDVDAKLGVKSGGDGTIGVILPILSRNRFAICLRGIAKGAKKIVLQLSYPSDEVGNELVSLDALDEAGVDPYSDVLSLEKYRELFGSNPHPFTGVDYVSYYGDLIKEAGADVEIIFANHATAILDYTKRVLTCDIHTRARSKRLLAAAGAEVVLGLDDILNAPLERADGSKSGFNAQYGLLGSNKSTEDVVKLFPHDASSLVNEIAKKLLVATGKKIEVMVYGDGAFKDPQGKIWELADPVVSPAHTDGLKGTPNELKLKYLADNDFAHLSGEELKAAISESIKSKDSDLVGNMASEGTTPRQLTDLIGSLCDLTSGSGDKGTPIVFIQGYFDNYTN